MNWKLIFQLSLFGLAMAFATVFWMPSIVNSVWITAAHVAFFATYIANHPEMAEMSDKMPMANHPRRMMILMRPVFGVLFGLILGLFAFIASKMVKNRRAGNLQ